MLLTVDPDNTPGSFADFAQLRQPANEGPRRLIGFN